MTTGSGEPPTTNTNAFGWFLDRWHTLVNERGEHRSDANTDLAVWRSIANDYDHNLGGTAGARAVVEHLTGLHRHGYTLLDVGAGTGRLAIPLATAGFDVTALDYSPDMLNVLRERAAAAGAALNIIEAEWATTSDVGRFDVVLAAWSIYRFDDLQAVLTSLIRAARTSVAIVIGTGAALPHRSAVLDTCGEWYESDEPTHLLVAAGLMSLGHTPNVTVLTRTIVLDGPDDRAIAAQISPVGATPAQIDALSAAIGDLTEAAPQGRRYTYQVEEAVLTCDLTAPLA